MLFPFCSSLTSASLRFHLVLHPSCRSPSVLRPFCILLVFSVDSVPCLVRFIRLCIYLCRSLATITITCFSCVEIRSGGRLHRHHRHGPHTFFPSFVSVSTVKAAVYRNPRLEQRRKSVNGANRTAKPTRSTDNLAGNKVAVNNTRSFQREVCTICNTF